MPRKEIRREKRQCSTKETKRKGVEGKAKAKGKEKDMQFGKLRSWMRESSGGRKLDMELRISRSRWAEAEKWNKSRRNKTRKNEANIHRGWFFIYIDYQS